MNWLLQYNVYVQGVIVSAIILLIIIIMLTTILLFRNDINRAALDRFSAFTGGVLLVAAIIGQFVAARDGLIRHFENVNSSLGWLNVSPSALQTIIIIAIFVAGLVLAFLLILFINYLHKLIHSHDHQKASEKIEKSLLMVLLHRFPAGITMGGLIFLSNKFLPNGAPINPLSLATLIVFILHIIPESIYAYYSYHKIQHNKVKSVIFSLLSTLMFIPLILLGIFIFQIVPAQFIYLQNILFIATGFVITWAVLTEILPNVLAQKSRRKFLNIIFFFIGGFILSLFFQTIHIH